jgi:hypothetical protein
MNTARQLRKAKENDPHLFCPAPGCLWRQPYGIRCPNHQTVKRTAPQDRLGALNAKPEHIGGIHKRKRDRIRVGNIG